MIPAGKKLSKLVQQYQKRFGFEPKEVEGIEHYLWPVYIVALTPPLMKTYLAVYYDRLSRDVFVTDISGTGHTLLRVKAMYVAFNPRQLTKDGTSMELNINDRVLRHLLPWPPLELIHQAEFPPIEFVDDEEE